MANSQDIEARLCAYIDGDLTVAERADIERHLADHPQHRQMIQDLMQTRKLVSSLPRLKAPADLGEGLQGQLERSMLLGEQNQPADPWRLGSGHVHKLAVTAALTVLVVGLGSVLFVLLRAAAHPAKMETMITTVAPSVPTPAPTPEIVPATQPTVVVAAPDTQPSSVVIASAPTTQPDAVATTQPTATADLDDNPMGDMLDPDAVAPATQPADATLAADPTTQPATPAATTMPVADDADDK
jgi:anti-sigma factor RsiW